MKTSFLKKYEQRLSNPAPNVGSMSILNKTLPVNNVFNRMSNVKSLTRFMPEVVQETPLESINEIPRQPMNLDEDLQNSIVVKKLRKKKQVK
jgi:hypothetical protein